MIINGDLTALNDENERGDISVQAKTTQNMDDVYRGLLAAQALAGAVSGEDGSISIAGSIVVVVDNAKTKVLISSTEDDTEVDPITMTGSKIDLEAYDKTKLAVRSGGVSVSKGSKVGVGVAVALIYANDKVDVIIGDGTVTRGDSLQINAEKARVDFSDYSFVSASRPSSQTLRI